MLIWINSLGKGYLNRQKKHKDEHKEGTAFLLTEFKESKYEFCDWFLRYF